jgi:molybdopterin/thiamine biosynthesis adenylyltransferase
MKNATLHPHFYQEMTKKNIGVYTQEEQNRLYYGKVIILGLGGVGGAIAMLCVRSGIGSISGVDPDTFEVSNLNRQAFATIESLGQSKSETAKKCLLEINPHLNVCFTYAAINEDNAEELLKGHDVVIEALDDMPSRIIAHRAARKLGIPSIAMSGSPPHRGFVSTFLPEGIDYETALNLPTIGKSMQDASIVELIQNIKKQRAENSVQHGAPQDWANDFHAGKVGWIITPIRATLIASFCAHEALQLLIKQQPLAAAPKGIVINLDNLSAPVSVIDPECGFWDAGSL